MSPSVTPTWYRPDSRGNRLDDWTVNETADGHVLWLRGPEEAALQVVTLDPRYQRLARSATTGSKWTHALRSAKPELEPAVQSLLDLLTEIITLPRRQNLDFAVALDWYKVPEEGVDPRQWSNTTAGGLVNAGKYQYRYNADRQRRAGLALVDMMYEAIGRHSILSRATVIIDVPGHDSTRVSFGSRVATSIARRWRIPMVRVQTRSEFRPEAKNLSAIERARVLDNQFIVPDVVRSESVLIVDDVFKSGASMKEVAKAARRSGASTVQGICGVRTISR
jgi:hypothetical protein